MFVELLWMTVQKRDLRLSTYEIWKIRAAYGKKWLVAHLS
jgi:hypothetical protein